MGNVSGDGYSPLYDEIIVIITNQPKSATAIAKEVSRRWGRFVSPGSASRTLRRAITNGCAVRTDDGYIEPQDNLSNGGVAV